VIPLTDSSATDTGSPASNKKTPPAKRTVFFGKGMIAAILGIVALLIVLLIISTMGSSSSQETIVPIQQCAENTISYVNTYLVQPGTEVSLLATREINGLYEMKASYQSQEITLYSSRDCSLLFTSGVINMKAAQPTPVPTKAPVKTARPTVDLYVMSFCPYGTQAMTVMRPVSDLLGEKADIRVRYITTVYGTTIENVDSMHGISEAKEDLYQVCVLKEENQHYWEYVRLFNEQCYPLWQNSIRLENCRANVTAVLGIDTASVEACTAGSDGIALLRADSEDSGKNNAGGSPTLLINGVEYRGARTPEAYKQAICNSFDEAPAECNTVLSSTSAYGSPGSC
jgi:hypothetical protein